MFSRALAGPPPLRAARDIGACTRKLRTLPAVCKKRANLDPAARTAGFRESGAGSSGSGTSCSHCKCVCERACVPACLRACLPACDLLSCASTLDAQMLACLALTTPPCPAIGYFSTISSRMRALLLSLAAPIQAVLSPLTRAGRRLLAALMWPVAALVRALWALLRFLSRVLCMRATVCVCVCRLPYMYALYVCM
eukprot:Tamp_24428.p2 GENE.Tamp_24428~~Tamp_24428.p2  ORF type:complete len:196 (-),score=5.81 Tamp_24428:31-618(-)